MSCDREENILCEMEVIDVEQTDVVEGDDGCPEGFTKAENCGCYAYTARSEWVRCDRLCFLSQIRFKADVR